MTPFWYGWPSWRVELLSGTLALVLVWAVFRLFSSRPERLAWLWLAAQGVSVGYELVLDPNGWSWADVGQRAVGITVAAAVAFVLSRIGAERFEV